MQQMEDFEKYAQQQLQKYESPVDAEKLWRKMEPVLHPDKKKRRFLFGFWLTAFVLSGATGISYYMAGVKNTAGSIVEQSAKTAIDTATTAQKSSPNTGVPAHKSSTNSTTIIRSNQIIGQHSSNDANTNQTTAHLIEKGPVTIRSNSGFSNISIVPTDAKNQDRSRNTPNNVPENAAQNTLAIDQKTIAASTTKSIDYTEKDQSLTAMPDLRLLEQRKFGVVISNSPFEKAHPIATLHSTDCFDWGKKKRFYPYFGVYGSAILPLKKLSAPDNASQAWLEKRRETESVLEGISVGAFAGLNLRNKWAIEAGGEYLRINERFDHKTFQRDTIGQVATIGILILAPGDTIMFSDTLPVLRETRTTTQIYNQYRFVNIPVSLSYNFKQKNNWDFYLKAGVSINVSFEQKAAMLDNTDQIVVYRSANAGVNYPFRTKMKIMPFGSIGTRYTINKHLSVFSELQYQHPQNSVTTTDFSIQQRYRLPGIRLGVQFR